VPSPLLPTFPSARDRQVDALRAVIEANLTHTLAAFMPGQIAVASSWDFPITLQTIPQTKLPALAVFGERAVNVQQGKQRLQERSFRIVWWLPAVAYDRIGDAWRLLQPAFETIVSTLNGLALYDLDAPGGVARRHTPEDILVGAGFDTIRALTIQASFNFVQDTTTKQAYPLMQVTFAAVCDTARGRYVYDPATLPRLTAFAAAISEEQREPEAQPAVRVQASAPESEETGT
jgi:hypothetical protein